MAPAPNEIPDLKLHHLSFAASPAFALMAWISANDVQAMICASGPDGLPIGGMNRTGFAGGSNS